MFDIPVVSVSHLVDAASRAMDLVSPLLADHQRRVGYIASRIAGLLDADVEEQDNLYVLGALHDCGALRLGEQLDMLAFEAEDWSHHAELSHRLLGTFRPLREISTPVKYHHTWWDQGRGQEAGGSQVPDGAFILHLADRVEVAMDRRTPILSQMDDIRGRIVEQSDKMFKPEHVEAFLTLAGRESFWLDLVNPTKDKAPRRRLGVSALLLDVEGLEQMARMFGHIVDFRSRFTATHSSGVAATAQSLAELSGFDHIEAKAMRIAGYLHDLGKLAVPAEILEKPAALSEDELGVVRTHSYHTYHVLDGISGFETINEWGAFHHERLDGRGYPFHHRDDAISVGSRIMAVADVLTALCEDRPYRAALGTDKALSILDEMVGAGAMDAGVVDLLEKHVDEVDLARVLEQQASARDYDAFYPEGEPAATPGATS